MAPPRHTPDGESPIAEEVLAELASDYGADALGGLIETYLAEAPEQLGELRAAIGRGDGKTAERTAHTLKSTSAIFGAQGLATTLGEVEGKAREGVLEDTAALLARAEALFEAVRARLARGL